MFKPVNWALQVWHGRVSPGHRALAVAAAILIWFIIAGVLLYYGLFSKVKITPAV